MNCLGSYHKSKDCRRRADNPQVSRWTENPQRKKESIDKYREMSYLLNDTDEEFIKKWISQDPESKKYIEKAMDQYPFRPIEKNIIVERLKKTAKEPPKIPEAQEEEVQEIPDNEVGTKEKPIPKAFPVVNLINENMRPSRRGEKSSEARSSGEPRKEEVTRPKSPEKKGATKDAKKKDEERKAKKRRKCERSPSNMD